MLRIGRNHHLAIAIAAQPIIRLYPHAAQRHGRLDRLNTHPILSGARPVTPGKNRVIKLQRTVDIAADTVNHRPGQLLTGGGRGQQVAQWWYRAAPGCRSPPPRIAEVGATQGVETGKNRGLHGVAFLVSDRLTHAGGVTECMDLVDDLARCRPDCRGGIAGDMRR